MKRSKLRSIRKKKKLTQGDVAKMAGICRQYYSSIENGKKRCSVDTWLRIGKALDIPPGELMAYITEGMRNSA